MSVRCPSSPRCTCEPCWRLRYSRGLECAAVSTESPLHSSESSQDLLGRQASTTGNRNRTWQRKCDHYPTLASTSHTLSLHAPNFGILHIVWKEDDNQWSPPPWLWAEFEQPYIRTRYFHPTGSNRVPIVLWWKYSDSPGLPATAPKPATLLCIYMEMEMMEATPCCRREFTVLLHNKQSQIRTISDEKEMNWTDKR